MPSSFPPVDLIHPPEFSWSGVFARGAGGGLKVNSKVKGLDRLILENYTCSLFHADVQPQLMALIRKEKEKAAVLISRHTGQRQVLWSVACYSECFSNGSVLQLVVGSAPCETNFCEGVISEPAFPQGMPLQAPPRDEGMSLPAKSCPLF